MRWEDELGDNRTPSFRTEVTTPGNFGFVALRLRAKIAQTGNPTNVPLDDQGDSDSNPAC